MTKLEIDDLEDMRIKQFCEKKSLGIESLVFGGFRWGEPISLTIYLKNGKRIEVSAKLLKPSDENTETEVSAKAVLEVEVD